MTIRRALLLVAHNLGDAVITAGFLEHLHSATPHLDWTVLCRPEAAFLFEGAPGIERVLPNRFPVGTNKQFNITAALKLLRTLGGLRKEGLVCSLDFIGDFRDVGIARLAGSRKHYSPVWPDGHPFRRIIRPAPRRWIHTPLPISSECKNLYKAMEGMIEQIAADIGVHALPPATPRFNHAAKISHCRIGLHPFATQACKLWPAAHWQSLAKGLLRDGYELQAFAAPSERAELVELFGELIADSQLLTQPLPDFFSAVRDLDLLIGLDSFSVHVAHSAGIRSIMLNGANDPGMWVPPSCTSLQEPAQCGNQPCLNRPSCSGTNEFDCMKRIQPGNVLKTSITILSRSAPDKPLGAA